MPEAVPATLSLSLSPRRNARSAETGDTPVHLVAIARLPAPRAPIHAVSLRRSDRRLDSPRPITGPGAV